PGAALDAPCPGYGFTAVCQTVARTDAPASPPGNSASLRSAPGAALDAPCPGYGFTAVCQTVARTDAPASPPGFSSIPHPLHLFPILTAGGQPAHFVIELK
ncbi:TPA: hypothetical protein ACTW87_005144, partial [Klebsiella oxytoca]